MIHMSRFVKSYKRYLLVHVLAKMEAISFFRPFLVAGRGVFLSLQSHPANLIEQKPFLNEFFYFCKWTRELQYKPVNTGEARDGRCLGQWPLLWTSRLYL